MKNNKQAERPSHSEETKLLAVKESRAAGNSVVGVAAKYGVSANTLQNWRKAYPESGAISAPRITRAQRTTVAIGGGNAELIQALRQDLAAKNAEIRLLRDMYFEQELRHRGLTVVGPTEATQARHVRPMGTAGLTPNGSAIPATN